MKNAFLNFILIYIVVFSHGIQNIQAEDKNSLVPSEEIHKMDLGAWRATQLMGIVVYNTEGNLVGSIVDMVGDVKGGVLYLVLSHGGVLGIGDKLIPLPWTIIAPGEKAGTIKIDLTKEALEQAPNFNSQKWPDFTQKEWNEKTKKYYDDLGPAHSRITTDQKKR